MNKYFEASKKIEDIMIKDRRVLHENPEVYHELPMTTKYVMEQLTSMGITPSEICKSGITAIIGGKKPGKTILLRADMDALPMQEETELPFASKNEYAHTCGHDIHTAGLLGAARLLKEHENELAGSVKLMFQPDEEGLTGAQAMIDAGVLEGVDAAIGFHVFPGDLFPGYIAGLPGYAMASADRFSISIKGKGSHGSTPHKSIDPINVGVHIYLGLQEIIAREATATDPLVITIGSFNTGGAPNIIPERAKLEGSIRAKTRESRELAKKRLVEISESVAKTYGATCKVTFLGGAPSLYNDPALTEEFISYMKDIAKDVVPMEFVMGSEDFAFIAEKVPAAYFGTGAGGKEDKYQLYYNHNPKVQFNESSMVYTAALFANCAEKWLENNK